MVESEPDQEEQCFNDKGEELLPYSREDAELCEGDTATDYILAMKFEILERVTGTKLDVNAQHGMGESFDSLFKMLGSLIDRAFIEGYKCGSTQAAESAIDVLKTHIYSD